MTDPEPQPETSQNAQLEKPSINADAVPYADADVVSATPRFEGPFAGFNSDVTKNEDPDESSSSDSEDGASASVEAPRSDNNVGDSNAGDASESGS